MRRIICLAAGLFCIFLSLPAHAVTTTVDGVTIFNQSDALAGGVTQGDAAGFPVTISKSGVYRLGSGLVMNKSDIAIIITAPFVEIDLNGHTINGAHLGTSGIVAAQRGLVFRNGAIRFFKAFGIIVAASELTVDNIRVTENGTTGIYQYNGNFARILNVTATGNNDGTQCHQNCYVSRSIMSNNRNSGARFSGTANIMLESTASNNGNTGIVVNDGTPPFEPTSLSWGGNSVMNNGGGSSYQTTGATYYTLQPNTCEPVIRCSSQ